ncbi:bifunctional folylpolyglutamate synthase/dihydrofolate synthase [Lentibacillus saliphilus]|uniref:bifunctional folylpolyglutamate synthase/dihydrofolate synthase n=1 Tax=Lentibacillus saliphilus TaxID=2737028 RepID=UPI001C2F4ADD|nr:folylpolyglutamate synthase/dihydrofolate synthase family protein [Lentibacillus saliphilus]
MDKHYVDAVQWIQSREQFGSRPGLHRIEWLLQELGNPHHDLNVIHIAGTNGKGSTVSYLKELLQNSGLNVGTFISPSIETFNDRICINGCRIPNDAIASLVNRLRPIVEQMDQDETVSGLTEFELVTAMMFVYFKESPVDVAVIEVGLGGLLDSTNVVQPQICGITTIGLDHIQVLGDSIEAIAEQKAGIIKPQSTVVTGHITAPALKVIEDQAARVGAQLYQYNQDYKVEHIISELFKEYFSFSNEHWRFPILNTSMLGKHQVENAGLALQIWLLYMEIHQQPVDKDIVRTSLNDAFMPGRMEVLAERPLVLVDGAHNVPAMERLANNVQDMYTNEDDRTLFILFSAIETKDVSGMIDLLDHLPNTELVLTSFEDPRAIATQDFIASCPDSIHVEQSWEAAIKLLLNKMHDDDVLLITGSLYFIAEVRLTIKNLLECHKDKIRVV